MKIRDSYVAPQPYSRALRAIAAMIEDRESDGACIAQITRFLERSGVPVRDRPEPRREQRPKEMPCQAEE